MENLFRNDNVTTTIKPLYYAVLTLILKLTLTLTCVPIIVLIPTTSGSHDSEKANLKDSIVRYSGPSLFVLWVPREGGCVMWGGGRCTSTIRSENALPYRIKETRREKRQQAHNKLQTE